MGSTASKPLRQASAAAKKAHQSQPTIITQLPESILHDRLKKLGQVQVESPLSIQKSQDMTHRAMTESTVTPQTPATNTIDANGLWQIFNLRKGASTSTSDSRLDPALIERLASRYNSPSIGRETARTMPDGEQRIYREAIWVDSTFKQ